MSRTVIVLAVVQCGAQICVARRTQSIATGRELWSVVTGYLEPGVDPSTQAWAEITEELGLRQSSLKVVRRLEPMPLASPTSGKEFLVHPFLFECDSGEELVLNWEYDDVQWADPSRLTSADCVSWQFPLVRALLHSQE